MYGEALIIQSTLGTLIREHRLREHKLLNPGFAVRTSWEDWVKFEGAKRTHFMIYCFFNFHSIIYNTAPTILNTELEMELPCSETAWRAPTATDWKDVYGGSPPEPKFQERFLSLFSDDKIDSSQKLSSCSCYILIHALIQQIFLLRQVARCRPSSDGSLSRQDLLALETALASWQREWRMNPESSLDPMDPHGPVPFTSMALLRVAYIRLHVDAGLFRSIESQDPGTIADAMFRSPAVIRSTKLTEAAIHSAHSLSIPIRLGVNLISRNHIFAWSLQHPVCSLECAFLLSKWLDAVEDRSPETVQLDDDEERLLNFVVNILAESDSDKPTILEGASEVEDSTSYTRLSARVVKVWANLFCGERVWNVINVVGEAMYIYGDLLEGNTPPA